MRTKILVTAGILAIIAAAAIAGSLDQTNPPSNAAGRMSTLTEIYNCLSTGNCVSKSTGVFAEPGSAPGSTGYTLDDIMNVAKQRARVPKTGQTTQYAAGDDGNLQKGVASPSPRFTDNSNGTVTDNLTGLIWLKNANCTDTISGINPAATSNKLTWQNALTWSAGLANGSCGLTDGSTAGQWRLPNLRELQSLIDYQNVNPALPTGHPFGSSVQVDDYWSATTYAGTTSKAWHMYLFGGGVSYIDKTTSFFVWPVR